MNQSIKNISAPKTAYDLETLELAVIDDNDTIEGKSVKDSTMSQLEAKSINIDGSVLESVEISSSKLKKANIQDSLINNCLLFGTNFDGSGLRRVHFDQGMMSGIIFSDCNLEDVVFDGVKLNLANFRSAKMKNVAFVDCDLQESDFIGAELTNVRFIRSNLSRAVMAQLKIKNVDLRTAEITLLKGVSNLKGAIIDTTQLLGISHELAHEVGIKVEDPL